MHEIKWARSGSAIVERAVHFPTCCPEYLSSDLPLPPNPPIAATCCTACESPRIKGRSATLCTAHCDHRGYLWPCAVGETGVAVRPEVACRSLVSQVFVDAIRGGLQQSDCSVLAALLKCMPPEGLVQMYKSYPEVCAAGPVPSVRAMCHVARVRGSPRRLAGVDCRSVEGRLCLHRGSGCGAVPRFAARGMGVARRRGVCRAFVRVVHGDGCAVTAGYVHKALCDTLEGGGAMDARAHACLRFADEYLMSGRGRHTEHCGMPLVQATPVVRSVHCRWWRRGAYHPSSIGHPNSMGLCRGSKCVCVGGAMPLTAP